MASGGFIDKTGKMVSGYQFSSTDGFSQGLAKVVVGGLVSEKFGYIDKTGKYLWQPSE